MGSRVGSCSPLHWLYMQHSDSSGCSVKPASITRHDMYISLWHEGICLGGQSQGNQAGTALPTFRIQATMLQRFQKLHPKPCIALVHVHSLILNFWWEALHTQRPEGSPWTSPSILTCAVLPILQCSKMPFSTATAGSFPGSQPWST